MSLSLYEQETIILYNQGENTAEVYTHDLKLMTKLERLAQKFPEQVIRKNQLTYLVPKRCVQIREPYSEQRRAAARERALASGCCPPKRKATVKTE